MVNNRQKNRQEVLSFLQRQFAIRHWDLTLPGGQGHETYIARSGEQTLFIKLGVRVDNYEAMAMLSLSPPIITCGRLANGITILVQPFIEARTPSWQDFHDYLPQFAIVLRKTHRSQEVQRVLPKVMSPHYRFVGVTAVIKLEQRWQKYKPYLSSVADDIDQALATLKAQTIQFTGGGLVASHNDICNGNWLIANDGRIYLVDLDGMSLDDPAHDLGALLWWYYPPQLRRRFLDMAEYVDTEALRQRMRVRMAIYSLSILLPREHSSDRFDPAAFMARLPDFKAVFSGMENPRGYNDHI